MERYKPIKAKKTSDLAVEAIWELIHTGELNPGDKLPPERELAKRFGISMTSLREALQKLESYGHITKKRGQGGGSIILDISQNTELELAVRKLMLKKISIGHMNQALKLGDQIFEIALKKITPPQIEKLKEISNKQKEEFQIHKGSVLGWKFMMEVARVTDNPILETVAELLMLLLMQKEFSLGIDDIGSSERVLNYNKKATEYSAKVIRAFETKDSVLLRTAQDEMAEALLEFADAE